MVEKINETVQHRFTGLIIYFYLDKKNNNNSIKITGDAYSI